MSDAPPAMSPDERYELAAASEASVRRNTPRHLVVLAGVVLLIASVFTILSWTSRANAERLLDARVGERDRIGRLAAEYSALGRAGETRADPRLGQEIPDLRSRMEGLAREAGLVSTPSFPRTETTRLSEGVTRQYAYTGVRDPSLGAMLRWAELATERIPGMHVRRVQLRPRAEDWEMEITFGRWERTGN